MKDRLATALRRVRQLVTGLPESLPSADRARDRLERDLLPRTAGGDTCLVAGIVGPNNAGKSALFNALVGRPVSPSVPSGGATRRLVGAAHPELLALLRAEPSLARFPLVALDAARDGAGGATAGEPGGHAALAPAGDPAELLVAAEEGLPAELMLIDTPDFDSILEGNRLASEALLAVADLAVAVVTRHSYQNREVVTFLREWLAHGRPWILVYNESPGETVAEEHAAKLAADVGSPPLARFHAPHDPGLSAGEGSLEPVSLEDGAPSLREVLWTLESAAEWKSRALAASLAGLRADLGETAAILEGRAAVAGEVLAAARGRAEETGRQVAAQAMPGGPFLDAFQAVIDRRVRGLRRGWRAGLRKARLQIERLPSLFRRSRKAEVAREESLGAMEARALESAWPGLWEDLARDLGPESRHPARARCPEEVQAGLDRDLDPRRQEQALEAAVAGLGGEAPEHAAFQAACEELVEAAIAERGRDWDIQAAADLLTLAPPALAALIIVKTGGLGADLAVAGGGALSTLLVEKYTHLLGSGITAEARRRWTDIRGGALARRIVAAALAETAPRLEEDGEREASAAARLREEAEALA